MGWRRAYGAEADEAFVAEVGFEGFDLFDEDVESEVELFLVQQQRFVNVVLDDEIVVHLG